MCIRDRSRRGLPRTGTGPACYAGCRRLAWGTCDNYPVTWGSHRRIVIVRQPDVLRARLGLTGQLALHGPLRINAGPEESRRRDVAHTRRPARSRLRPSAKVVCNLGAAGGSTARETTCCVTVMAREK